MRFFFQVNYVAMNIKCKNHQGNGILFKPYFELPFHIGNDLLLWNVFHIL